MQSSNSESNTSLNNYFNELTSGALKGSGRSFFIQKNGTYVGYYLQNGKGQIKTVVINKITQIYHFYFMHCTSRQ